MTTQDNAKLNTEAPVESVVQTDSAPAPEQQPQGESQESGASSSEAPDTTTPPAPVDENAEMRERLLQSVEDKRKDVESLAEFTRRIFEEEQKAKTQAQEAIKLAQDWEAKYKEIEQKMSEQDQAAEQAAQSNPELAELRQELNAQREIIQQYQQELENKKAEKADLELRTAAQAQGVREEDGAKEVIQVLLKEHVTKLSNESPELLQTFNVSEWIGSLKETKSFLFKPAEAPPAPPAQQLANSGLPIGGSSAGVPGQSTETAVPPMSTSKSEAKKTTSDFEAYLRQNGLK